MFIQTDFLANKLCEQYEQNLSWVKIVLANIPEFVEQ